MSFLKRSFLVAACLAVPGAGAAGPLDEADAAHSRRDYETEIARLRPLAEKGDAVAQRKSAYFIKGVFASPTHGNGMTTTRL